MMPVRTVLAAVALSVSSALPAMATDPIEGAVNLNRKVPFATLALVPEAVHSRQIARYNRYNVIRDGQTVDLSGQYGYCFIATHFDFDNNGRSAQFSFQIFHSVDGEEVPADSPIRGTVAITNNNASTRFPSYCINARQSGATLKVIYNINVDDRQFARSFVARFG